MLNRAIAVENEDGFMFAVATEDKIYSPLQFIENKEGTYSIVSLSKADLLSFYATEEEMSVCAKAWCAVTTAPDPEGFDLAWMVARTLRCEFAKKD